VWQRVTGEQEREEGEREGEGEMRRKGGRREGVKVSALFKGVEVAVRPLFTLLPGLIRGCGRWDNEGKRAVRGGRWEGR
jgi:hypothetical protein